MAKPQHSDDFNLSTAFTDTQLADIVLLRAQGLEWEELREKFNKRHKGTKSLDALKHAYRKYGNFFESDSDTVKVAHLKEIQRVKKTNSKTARENKSILDYLNAKETVLDEIKQVVADLRKDSAPKIVKAKLDKDKRNMTLELMLSDLHYGKKTKEFNLDVARARMAELARVVIKEIERSSMLYNVHRVIIALIGDIIESYTMHGLESARGCEFGNSKQVYWATYSIFHDLILPIALKGIDIDVPAVTGNHDRTEQNRTYNNPGEENLTWIIYNTLKDLCAAKGLANVKFHIPTGPYVVLPVYSNKILYEHGDNAGNSNRDTLEKLLNKRQSQTGQILNFFRLGHFHEYSVLGRGRIIVNGSLPGQDSYADVLGFDSIALQVLNYYVETKDRPTCFYRSFPIHLG